MQGQSSQASVNPTNTPTPTANTTSDAGTCTGTTNNLNRDMAWEWGVAKDPLKKQNIWCKLCDKRVCGGITRLKEHLTHTGGNVTRCAKVTTEITKKVLASMQEKEKKKKEKIRTTELLRSAATTNIDISDNEDEEEDVSHVTHVKDVGKKRKFVSTSNSRGPLDTMLKTNHGKTMQTTLDKNNPIKERLKKIAWKKIAIWAYSVGLPFNAVRDEGFQDAIYAIGDYGRCMPAPSYHNIRVTLLKDVLEDTQMFVDSYRAQWQKFGCSIMSDFWTDGKGRCLINFLVNCPTGTVFLKSIDASEHVKDAQLIVKMINEVIKDVGEENILQFITDNGSNYKLAGKILEEQHPKLFWTPCAAHCVNLMIGDIGEKIPKIKNVLSDARAIVVYIYNHGRVLNMMRKLTKNKELHRSCVTRFATQFYTLQSVFENRHHLQVLFVSEAWTKSNFAKQEVGKRVERIVAKQEFWDNVYLACQVLAPLVDLVRLVDTEEKPCMGYIYDAMSRAKEQITKNIKGGSNERLTSRVLSYIQTRWTDQLHHPLHAAAYFLNPAIFYGENTKDIEKNEDIMTGLYVAIDRLVPDEDENDKLRQELNLYIDSEGQFGSVAAKRSITKVAPYIWWRSYGISTPLLQTFAIKVLSQTCSASPCERNWSAFDNLHSKKRNCLLQQKLNDLVFIQYNTRLQRRFQSLKSNSLDPILLKDIEENDEWTIPTEAELQEFVKEGDNLLWSDAQEAMRGNANTGPTTRSKRERYRDDDEVIVEVDDVGEELDALHDVDSDAEPFNYD